MQFTYHAQDPGFQPGGVGFTLIEIQEILNIREDAKLYTLSRCTSQVLIFSSQDNKFRNPKWVWKTCSWFCFLHFLFCHSFYFQNHLDYNYIFPFIFLPSNIIIHPQSTLNSLPSFWLISIVFIYVFIYSFIFIYFYK